MLTIVQSESVQPEFPRISDILSNMFLRHTTNHIMRDPTHYH